MWALGKINLCKMLRFLRTLIAEAIKAGETTTYRLLLLLCALKVAESIFSSGFKAYLRYSRLLVKF